MSDDTDRYEPQAGGGKYIYDRWDQKLVPAKIDTQVKAPTYRHAQKEAMKRGDAGVYFMQKSRKKVGKKKRSKARAPQSRKKNRKYQSGKR